MKVSQEQRSNNKNKKYNFTIWTYHKVCELGVGKSFGDIALGKDISNRTATVIANEDAVLGSLHKDVYQICIKDAQEKHRKLNIEYVLSQKLFENFNPDIFERYYFNFFRNVRVKRGDILYSQGNNPTEIYFLFDGEVEIQSKISLNFCTEIISIIKPQKKKSLSEMKINRMNLMHPKMNKFYHDAKTIRAFVEKNKNILGLEDQIINGTYFTSAICSSDYCDYYAIEKNFFIK